MVAVLAGLLTAGCGGTGLQPELVQPTTPVTVDDLSALVPAQVARDGILVIGTDPSYAPMEFLSPGDPDLRGADIELATAVARALGLEPRFDTEAFSALTDAVRSRRVELAVSSLTVPPDQPIRADAVLYYQSANQLVAAHGVRLNRRKLCGRHIATVEGSTQVRALARMSAVCRDDGRQPIRIEALSTQDEVTDATAAGKVEGMLSDAPVASFAIAHHPHRLRRSGAPFDPAPFGMLTAPSMPALARAVRAAVQHLIDSGYYSSVLRRWGISAGAVSQAHVHWHTRARPHRSPG